MSNTTQPAFPLIDSYESGAPRTDQPGLTKLEYAAIHAMQGLLAARPHELSIPYGEVAKESIEQAKELLKQLENENHL